jgi:hypothetical protein
MPDIYNRVSDAYGGSFASDQSRVTFPALTDGNTNVGADVGLLMQSLQTTYSQQITRLFELGSPNVYYVGGRTSGTASVQRVMGPKKLSASFYSTYGDVCRARQNTLHFSLVAGCDSANSGQRASYTCHFVVITTVAVGVTAGDMMINESLQMMFSSFLYA